MKSLVRQCFSAPSPRCEGALLDELQPTLEHSPAEAALVIATVLADGVFERARQPGDGHPGAWLAYGPPFAALASAAP